MSYMGCHVGDYPWLCSKPLCRKHQIQSVSLTMVTPVITFYFVVIKLNSQLSCSMFCRKVTFFLTYKERSLLLETFLYYICIIYLCYWYGKKYPFSLSTLSLQDCSVFFPLLPLSLPLFSKIISVTCCPWLVILCTGLVYDSEREVSKFEENETFFGLIMMHTPWSGSSQVFLIWKNLLEILASAITPCFGPLWIEFI